MVLQTIALPLGYAASKMTRCVAAWREKKYTEARQRVKEKAVTESLNLLNAPTDPDNGFQVRDLLRFFAVDIVIAAAISLFRLMGFFPSPNLYVAAILGGKVVLFVYLLRLIRLRRQAWKETGVASAGRWTGWLLAFAIYAVSYPLLIWVGKLNILFMRQIYAWGGMVFIPVVQDSVFVIFTDVTALWIRAVLILFALVIGPFMEELAFRGVGVDAFRRTGGSASALLWTSFLFGLYHFDLSHLFPLTLLGAVFALARLASGSLWCAFLVHFLHNTIALAITAHSVGWFTLPEWL